MRQLNGREGTPSLRGAQRESARARSRLSSLKTNRRDRGKPPRKSGLPEIGATLRDRWGEIAANGISFHDILAGLTVATVAIPLNVALALAAGLPASAGLIAGGIGGFVAAAFGGSNYQVSGPAAALNVLVFGIVSQFGPGGAAAAALVCGVVTILIALLGFGKLADLLPKLVLAGFTTGVGLKLLDQQIPILLGVKDDWAVWEMITHFMEFAWLREVQWLSVVCGIIVAWITVGLAHLKSFPSALLGIIIATFIAYELDWDIAKVGAVDVTDISLAFPSLRDGTNWFDLIIMAIPLALLSGAESLISAKSVDQMSGGKSGYNSNTELFGQGMGNLAVSFLGGMSLAGVIIRSSVNYGAGARTRMAAMFHGVFLGVAVYFFGHSLSVIPVAALAGLLVVIAWRLIKVKYFIDALRDNRLHAIAFLAAAIGTLFGYLITGIGIGCIVMYLDHVLEKRKSRVAKDGPVLRPTPMIRAVVNKHGVADSDAHGAHDGPVPLREAAVWSKHVRTKPKIHPTAYVHPAATVIGWVEISREVNVAADTSVRADEGAPFYIGARSNIQDGVVMHALKEKWVRVDGRQWAIWIGEDCSLAHQALVHGPSMIGDRTFIGFKAIVHDSIVGEGCFISHNALVVGVEIPPGKLVPSGWVVDSPEKVKQLPNVAGAHSHFNEDVVQVNRGLVMAYARHTPTSSAEALEGMHDAQGENGSQHVPQPTTPRRADQLFHIKPL